LSGYHEYEKMYTKIVRDHSPFHSRHSRRQFSIHKKFMKITQIMQRKTISTKELMLILALGAQKLWNR